MDIVGEANVAAPAGTDVLVAVCVPFTSVNTTTSPIDAVNVLGENAKFDTATLMVVAFAVVAKKESEEAINRV